MSSDDVEIIHLRFKEELARLGFSLAEASRKMGEKNPQRLRDVVNGRQKIPAEMLGNAKDIGVDVIFVLTGEKNRHMEYLHGSESGLLASYRSVSPEMQNIVSKLLNEAKPLSPSIAKPYEKNGPQEEASPISQMVLTDSPDVTVLKQVIERVERILMDEQISLTPEQKARVIVACMHASLKLEGGDTGTHISTAIRAVI